MRITVFSTPCEALFTKGKVRLHRFAWIFAGWDNHTPDSVPASLSGVSYFDGVTNMKTPDFSLFSLPLKILLHFCRSPRMPFLPLPFQRRIPALARSPVLSNTLGHGAASPAGGIPFGRSCIFQGAVASRQVQFNEKSGLLPYIQKVGKRVRKAEISTLIEICAIMGSRTRGGTDMNIKLTIPERLKDLRIERGLTLEQLSEATGISRAALGKYEADDFKDISPFSIAALAKFYGVSADYLMGLTETKNHPNTELEALHLGDNAIEVLKDGQFNHRLLSELICHKDFQRLMLDAEIYVDRIADMRINDMNAVLEAVRQMVLAKREDSTNDLYLRTLELAQVPEEEYFGHVVADDLTGILRDIRENHRTDSTTADEPSAAAQAQQQLQAAMNFEGSSDEKKARAFLATFGIDYDAITKEQFITLIEILRLSKHMKSPISQRGKGNMTHGKGKRKRK